MYPNAKISLKSPRSGERTQSILKQRPVSAHISTSYQAGFAYPGRNVLTVEPDEESQLPLRIVALSISPAFYALQQERKNQELNKDVQSH